MAGARAALGASFAESYGVWYSLCGRATVGNAAYDVGAAATLEASRPNADAAADAHPPSGSLHELVEMMDTEV